MQTQILDAMNQDSELPLASLRVDSGMTVNNLLLQLQADLLGINIGMSQLQRILTWSRDKYTDIWSWNMYLYSEIEGYILCFVEDWETTNMVALSRFLLLSLSLTNV